MSNIRQIAVVAIAGGLGGIALTVFQRYFFGGGNSQSSPSSSTRLNTIHAFLGSYRELSPAALIAHLTPNFTHQVLPSSLESPIRDFNAFVAHAGMVTSFFKSFEMIPTSVYEDPSSNAVVVHAKMVGEVDGMGPWENDCVMLLKMSKDGTKIDEMKEFVDSAKAKIFKEKLMAKMGKKEGVHVEMKEFVDTTRVKLVKEKLMVKVGKLEGVQ
jgi:hypothetical protein